MERFGFTADHVAERARALLSRSDGNQGGGRADRTGRTDGKGGSAEAVEVSP